MNTPSYSNERRATRRFAATCDAELVANLSILDTNVEISTEPLVFFGQTIDLSPRGIGLVIPSVHIDERYCDGVNQLRLAVHLPNGAASFHVNAVRCMPVNNHDLGEGYVVGTRILRVLQYEEEFIEFLGNLSSKVKV